MTRDEAVSLVAAIKAAYPRQPISEDTLATYVALLRDLERAEAARALAQHIATSQWPPTIAEIRMRVAESRCGAPRADEAWQEVLGAVRRYGTQSPPKWSHPAVTEAVRALSWRTLCEMTEETRASDRARFLDFYRSIRERAVTDANLRTLPSLGSTSDKRLDGRVTLALVPYDDDGAA